MADWLLDIIHDIDVRSGAERLIFDDDLLPTHLEHMGTRGFVLGLFVAV